ncbi:MAG: hypothetical protein M3P06_20405 [Acidobacteriota bacterium]|nr:hypothetical protein [Acidobacteriota bacterium]
MDSRIDSGILREACKKIVDRLAELRAQAVLLLVVPILYLFEVTFREASNDDAVLHRFRRRSATSLQLDSASGFVRRSSNR